MIGSDLEFCVSIAYAKPRLTVLSFLLMPYVSLIAVESSAYFNISINEEHVTDLRAKAKFLDNKNINIDETLELFRSIIDDHQRHFAVTQSGLIGRVKRYLQSDIGVFMYGEKFIGTTILFNYFASLASRNTSMHELSLGVAHDVSVKVGGFIGDLHGKGKVVLDIAKPNNRGIEIPIKYRDRKSEKYYPRLFDGKLNSDAANLVQTYMAMLSLSRVVLDSSWVNEFTLFKIRYLTLFHVISSVRKMQGYFRVNNLSNNRSNDVFKEISSDQISKLLLSRKVFRNIMVHYKINESSIVLKENMKLYGLVEACFNDYTFLSLEEAINIKIDRTIIVLENWMNNG